MDSEKEINDFLLKQHKRFNEAFELQQLIYKSYENRLKVIEKMILSGAILTLVLWGALAVDSCGWLK